MALSSDETLERDEINDELILRFKALPGGAENIAKFIQEVDASGRKLGIQRVLFKTDEFGLKRKGFDDNV